jgi:hypothetical protein
MKIFVTSRTTEIVHCVIIIMRKLNIINIIAALYIQIGTLLKLTKPEYCASFATNGILNLARLEMLRKRTDEMRHSFA